MQQRAQYPVNSPALPSDVTLSSSSALALRISQRGVKAVSAGAHKPCKFRHACKHCIAGAIPCLHCASMEAEVCIIVQKDLCKSHTAIAAHKASPVVPLAGGLPRHTYPMHQQQTCAHHTLMHVAVHTGSAVIGACKEASLPADWCNSRGGRRWRG